MIDEKDYGDLYDVDAAFLEKRKQEYQEFLRRWNSPEAVKRRGGLYFTAVGWRKCLPSYCEQSTKGMSQ